MLKLITQNALTYVALLRQHIQKEDNILVVMADRAIPVAQQQKMSSEFTIIEDKEIGAGIRGKYLRIAAELANILS